MNLKDTKGRERPSANHRLVFSRVIRLKNGRVLIAEHYGLKCFAFWVKDKR